MSNPAKMYESYMVPTLFGPWADQLIAAAAPQPGDRVLDVGCGTGVVARGIASRVEPGGKVTGVDLSPGMLEVAEETSEHEGLSINWHEGQAESLPFPDGSFDLVTSQYALMFFADRAAALAEMRRVLADGGRLAVSTWQPIERHPFYNTLNSTIEERLGMSGVKEIFCLGDENEVRRLIEGAGLREVELQSPSMENRFPEPEAFLAGEIDVDTAAIPSMQQLSHEERKRVVESISAEMQGPLAEVTQGNEVVLPFHAHIFTARK